MVLNQSKKTCFLISHRFSHLPRSFSHFLTPLSHFRFPQSTLSGFCSAMAFCSTPPPHLSLPLSPSLSLQNPKLFAPLAYPRPGGPSYALHCHAKRGIRFSDPPHPPPRLKVLCSSDYKKAAAITGDSWEKSILNSETPVLVEFYASWCGPCRMVHRVIDEIAEDYAGRLKCFVLNTDHDLHIAEKYEIKAVPVVFLFKNGEKRESVVGTMPKEFYVAAIERVLAS